MWQNCGKYSLFGDFYKIVILKIKYNKKLSYQRRNLHLL